MTSTVKRKLAAIMFTDIAGFTDLSSKDEDSAFKLIEKQRELIKPLVKKFEGEWLKEMGDGIVLSFPSSLQAVKCAIKIQHSVSEIQNLNLRIGIHQGDILEKDGDIYGDDVNVASRIEPFAAIGGIAISDKVQRDIASHPEFDIQWIAQPSLKGVLQEIKVYCIASHNLPTSTISEISGKMESKTSLFNRTKLLNIFLLAFITLLVGYYIYSTYSDDVYKNIINPQYERITFLGNIESSAISPNGEYIAYGYFEENNISVVVREMNSDTKFNIFTLKSPVVFTNYIKNFRWSVDGEYILISGIFDKVKNTLKIPKFGGEIEKMPYHITSSPDGKRGLHYWTVSKIIPITNLDNGEIIDSVKISFDYTFLQDVKWSTKDDLLLFTTQKEGNFIFWTVSVDGNKVNRILDETSEVSFPIWSPKGDAIYYLQAQGNMNNLMKIKIDRITGESLGKPIALISGLPISGDVDGRIYRKNMSISETGKLVILSGKSEYSNLFSAELISSPDSIFLKTKQLTEGTRSINGFDTSPDGKLIAFSLNYGIKGNIYTMPISGGEKTQITFFDSSHAVSPAWSPDGKEIAFIINKTLWKVNLRTGKKHQFENITIGDTKFVCWAPSEKIIFHKEGNRNFYTLNPSSNKITELIKDEVGWPFHPKFSPDMKNLALFWNRRSIKSDSHSKIKRGLWVIPYQDSLDEQSAQFIKEGDVFPFGWSDDSKFIYATVGDWILRRNQKKIIKLNLFDGEIIDSVYAPPFTSDLANVNSDGKTFILTIYTEAKYDLWNVTNFDPQFTNE